MFTWRKYGFTRVKTPVNVEYEYGYGRYEHGNEDIDYIGEDFFFTYFRTPYHDRSRKGNFK